MIKTFQAFAGYDSQLMALDRLGINYQCVGWSEIDKYAIQAHNAVFPDLASKNYGDISKIDWATVPDFDLFTYSFPCQDISNAGNQRGLEEGSGTRSSLLWECCKAIEAKKPKYLLMENVKALTQKKFLPYLMKWESYLRGLGYSNFTKVLNAKDFGVPQNRERVFMVSVLSDELFFCFPSPFVLKKRLGDILEENVDEKYYLSQKCIDGFIRHNEHHKAKGTGFLWTPKSPDDVAVCLRANPALAPTDNTIMMEPFAIGYTRDKNGNVTKRHLQEYTNTLHSSTGSGGNTDCFIAEPKIMQVGNLEEDKGFKNPQRGRVYSPEGISPTLDNMSGGNRQPKVLSSYRIRKLTPRECFRLMGVSEENINKIQEAGISNSQQYKMAGNSIVVDVLFYIFKNLFPNDGQHD